MQTLVKSFVFLAVSLLAIPSCTQSPYDFVDVKIGTGGHGHVFVGASVPFGMVQLGPTSIPVSWDFCSGYHESDSSVIGFSHTHLSGTGVGDLFDVTVMPVTGKNLTYSRGVAGDIESGLWSPADRNKEIAEPSYYSVPLTRYGILAELTATRRVGLHRYSYPEGTEDNAIVFDLENGGCYDKPTDVSISVIDSLRIEGYRFSKGWAQNQRVWFAAEFSKPFISYEEINDKYWRFNFDNPEIIEMKVALSPSGTSEAWANMEKEVPGWNFDEVAANGKNEWNKELDKIKLKEINRNAKKKFYTALYHTMIMPALYCDCDSANSYTYFSLWDTYRALMPLYTIIQPEKEDDFINSLLNIYDAQGYLPLWPLMGNDTNCMVGNPAICVIADAILKGFHGFDWERAYEAMKNTAMGTDRWQDLRLEYGYIPADLTSRRSVALDMEYCIADAALAEAAKYLGKTEDYEFFRQRSLSYKTHFDKATGFFRGLNADGGFNEPFDPFNSSYHNVYCEGNAWQYLYLAPHDLDGLVEHVGEGNRDRFLERLDSLFILDSHLGGDNVASDMTGLIGQYVHGNEPSHHILYFYAMLGENRKGAELIRKVCTELYTDATDGLCGNEDGGQMSAWYILSSLGFYQVEPAGGRFYFGAPQLRNTEIQLPEGKTFTIKSNTSNNKRFIKKVFLNNEEHFKNYIDYKDIMNGGTLEFVMCE